MGRPKKKDVSEINIGSILYNRGYNSCCDDWEKWLPSEEEIKKVVLKWAQDQEAIDKLGNIVLGGYATDDLDEIVQAIRKRLGVCDG